MQNDYIIYDRVMIIADESKLITECKDVSIMEISGIVKKLETALKDSKQPGVGLAANQIGINRKVCIIRTDKYSLDLANPRIIEQYDLCEFHNEGCLSYPDIWLKTKRYNEIFVIDDLHPAGIILTDVMAVITQHETNHVYGKTMFQYKIPNLKNKDLCWCNSGKRYKKCHMKKIIKIRK